jgi:hypothetical protein
MRFQTLLRLKSFKEKSFFNNLLSSGMIVVFIGFLLVWEGDSTNQREYRLCLLAPSFLHWVDIRPFEIVLTLCQNAPLENQRSVLKSLCCQLPQDKTPFFEAGYGFGAEIVCAHRIS